MSRHHAALSLYRERKFSEAGVTFAALATERPDFSLYTIYSQRCSAYAIEAPPAGLGQCDGV